MNNVEDRRARVTTPIFTTILDAWISNVPTTVCPAKSTITYRNAEESQKDCSVYHEQGKDSINSMLMQRALTS